MKVQIFPVPAHLKNSGAVRDLSCSNWIILPENASFPLKNRTMEFASLLSGKYAHPVRVTAGKPSAGELLIVMDRKKGPGMEDYELKLEKTGPVRIQASGDTGFFYGLQSAVQLLADPGKVSCCTIKDAPSFPERGYMLDISRNKVPTMKQVKDLVRSLSLLRYNSLQLYMEHTFAFAGHERVWAGFTPFTPEEIMELDAFCREYFVELVPNLNSFGHLGRWLCHEEYKNLAECDPPYQYSKFVKMQAVLQPCQKSLDFIDSLYAEFLPNFTSRKLNIGCDETVELGKGKSAGICKKKGTTEVYLDFLRKLASTAEKYGFDVEFWGDIIKHKPELISQLPKKVTALEWGYEASHPFAEDTLNFKKSGIPFIVCPGTSAWLTYIGRTTNMIGNIKSAVANGLKNGARGLLMTDWGDLGHHQYYPVSFPGITMGGGASWNAGSTETADMIPYGISVAFVPGKEGSRLGEFLLKAGKIRDDFSTPMSNSTAYGRVFQFYDRMIHTGKECDLAKIKVPELRKAIKDTQALLKSLNREPFCSQPLIQSELENGLRMAYAAMIFMERAITGKWDRGAWLDEMRHVIAQHELLWLARNRSGGLHESSNILRRAMDLDPDAWK